MTLRRRFRSAYLTKLRPKLRSIKNRYLRKARLSVYWNQDFLNSGKADRVKVRCEHSDPFFDSVTDPLNPSIIHHHANQVSLFVTVTNPVVNPANGAISIDGHLLTESIAAGARHPLLGLNPLRRKLQVPVLAVPRKNWNYYHWLVESLPKIVRALDTEPELNVLLSPNPPDYVRESLELVGAKILFSRRGVRVPTAYFLSGGSAGAWPQPEDLKLVRDRILRNLEGHESTPAQFIYVSRRKSSRAFSNEEVVESELKKRGFTVLYMEELSFIEQVAFVRSAKVICGNHGAGLTNLMFSPPGSTVLEVSSKAHPNFCFENMCKHLGIDFRRFWAEPEMSLDNSSVSDGVIRALCREVDQLIEKGLKGY